MATFPDAESKKHAEMVHFDPSYSLLTESRGGIIQKVVTALCMVSPDFALTTLLWP